MKRYILFLVLSKLFCFGKIAYSAEMLDVILHSGIEFLHGKGLTGKSVKVAVFDDFSNEHSTHGKEVVSVLKKVAPNIEAIEVDTDNSDTKLSCHIYTLYAENESDLSLSLKLLDKETVTSGYHQKDNPLVTLPSYYAAQDYNQEPSTRKFEEISFPPHTKLTLKVTGLGPFATLPYDNRDYLISVNQFAKKTKGPKFFAPHGEWSLSCDPNIATSPLDDLLAKRVTEQIANDVKIINFSRTFSDAGPRTVEAIKEFAKKGGIWISAAGNNPIAYQEKNLSSKFFVPETKEIDIPLLLNIPHLPFLKDGPFLIVGALCRKNKPRGYIQEKAPYSALAGALQDNFITALVEGTKTSANNTRESLSGTSFSAPQVSGVIALLQEYYSDCTPQILARAIRNSAVTCNQMPRLPNGDLLEIQSPIETGKGSMNPEGAFQELSKK